MREWKPGAPGHFLSQLFLLNRLSSVQMKRAEADFIRVVRAHHLVAHEQDAKFSHWSAAAGWLGAPCSYPPYLLLGGCGVTRAALPAYPYVIPSLHRAALCGRPRNEIKSSLCEHLAKSK
jgi:hypothetical protein